MNPLTGIIDSYDVHVPWRNGSINLPGVRNGRRKSRAQSLFDFVAESL